ncbi:MAG: thiamine diphosphokinase [Bacteroidota bacterium]
MAEYAAVLVGGGEVDAGKLARMLQTTPILIGADGGALAIERAGGAPHWVVGDGDSLGENDLLRLQAEGVRVRRYPHDKDQTDMEIALELAVELGADSAAIFGATGTRLDHTVTNLGMLRRAAMLGLRAAIFAPGHEIMLLRPGRTRINGAAGQALSLIPLTPEVTGVATENLRFPLRGESLFLGGSRGVHNEFIGAEAAVTLVSGELLAFVFAPDFLA